MKILTCFLALSLTLFYLALPCFALIEQAPIPLVNVRVLLDAPEKFDGQIIQFEGELFGQALHQNHGVWFHLLDEEGSAIGVWAKKEDVLPFTYYGKYRIQGDHVVLTGVYHKACQTHGGDTDIHLLEIKEIKSGNLLEAEPIEASRVYLLITLLLLFMGLLGYISRVGASKTESQ